MVRLTLEHSDSDSQVTAEQQSVAESSSSSMASQGGSAQQLQALASQVQQLSADLQQTQGQLQATQGQLQSTQQQLVQQSQQGQATASTQAQATTSTSLFPSQVKLEKPQPFKGVVNATVVANFLYACELYFGAAGLTTDTQKVAFVCLLLVEDASTWLQVKYTPTTLATLSWNTLRGDLESAFKPVDSAQRARDQLANCRQTGNVSAYTNAFNRIVLQCVGVSAEEKKDRYVRGLRKEVQKQVRIANPADFEDAALVANRVEAGENVQGYPPARSGSSSHGGPVPMELGGMQGGMRSGGSRGGGSSGGGADRQSGGRPCFYCGELGHWKRQCPKRRQRQPGRLSAVSEGPKN